MNRSALLVTCSAALAAGSLLPAFADTPRAIDPERSWLKITVYKEGLFAFAGDNHEVTGRFSSGSFDAERRSVELIIDARTLQVQDPPSRREKVQANMTGPVLDVARNPTIAFRSTRIDESDPKQWRVQGDLTLHGQTRPIGVTVTPLAADRFAGSATFKQTAFGITPIRVAGGTIRVKDEVRITFEVVLK